MWVKKSVACSGVPAVPLLVELNTVVYDLSDKGTKAEPQYNASIRKDGWIILINARHSM